MNDEPKPATPLDQRDIGGWRKPASGQWTVHQWKDKESYDVKCGDKMVCSDLLLFEANSLVNAHNAALAAAVTENANQPKPATGEWTADYVADRFTIDASSAGHIADAHNAALAAAGEANIRTNEMLTNVRRERDEAQKQLAAEREKREYWEQAYKQLFDVTTGKL